MNLCDKQVLADCVGRNYPNRKRSYGQKTIVACKTALNKDGSCPNAGNHITIARR